MVVNVALFNLLLNYCKSTKRAVYRYLYFQYARTLIPMKINSDRVQLVYLHIVLTDIFCDHFAFILMFSSCRLFTFSEFGNPTKRTQCDKPLKCSVVFSVKVEFTRKKTFFLPLGGW